MKKSVLLLVLLLVIQLCGCSLVPVGTRTSDIETLKNWSFQHNEGTNDYMDALQVEPSEFELIKYPERGTCLYRCGNSGEGHGLQNL